MSDQLNFLSSVLAKRIKWVEANRENDFEEGIQTLLTELYPDTAHFIFELLQNAEDAGATKIVFNLKKNMLRVTHNGKRVFDEKDVESITNIGKSTKKDDVNQIGKFGVGFKSVFSYTSTPLVHSCNFSFELRDLVCPYAIQKPLDLGQHTLFEFPFNHEKKNAEQSFNETANMLQSLKENVLLFLNNIDEVEWQIEGQGRGFVTRLPYNENHIEIDYQSVTGERATSHWLRFTKPYREDAKLHIAIAFKLSFVSEVQSLLDDKKTIAKQMTISPIYGRLSIFFPAEKETTNLKFHIHGPYASTVARDSIPDKNEGNKKLLQMTASLLAESLHKIQEMGLLTAEFLAVLPNDTDELAEFYKPIQAAVIKEMKSSPLVPTHSKDFASADNLYQGPAAIREVISDDDLGFLSDTDQVKWAIGVMQNSRQEKFMKTLGIDEWGWPELTEAIEDKFYSADKNALSWLSHRKDMWMQKLYGLLKKALDSEEIRPWKLRQCEIIRLESGEHTSGDGVYFPDLIDKDSKGTSALPRVRTEIFKGRKEQIEKIRQFLEYMGVKEVGEKEEVEYIFKTYYSENSKKTPSIKQHIQHMKKFISYWNGHKEDTVDMFSGYEIFHDYSGSTLRSAEELYIDMPYLETGLTDFFQNTKNVEVKKYKLWDGYAEKRIANFKEFTKAAGVMHGLELRKASATLLQPRIFQKNGNQTVNTINQDHFVNGLHWYNKQSSKYIGMFKLDCNNIYLSKLLWKCMSNASPEILRAKYKPNAQYNETTDSSLVIKQLKEYSWIPDKKGNFHKPCDITQDMLHKDFPYDDRNGWLTAIGFGENQKKQTEEYKTFKTLCENMGFDDDTFELINELKGIASDEQKQLLKDIIGQLKTKRLNPSFPEKESADPERRASKIKENLAGAPEKEYEVRDRSVRTTSNEIKPDGKIYLRNNYTNEDGEMFCQVCKEVMPFKLDDGSHYFEAVECIKDFPKECRENYLALCPVCAAKYKHANTSKPEDLRAKLSDTDNEDLSIPVTIAREDKTIRFVKIHLEDLRTILNEK
ncbi:MAG: ATP-binding protein [Nitrospirae bacterium]|nr:ATP-binding protein [Nitrospirota bacterium]